MGLEHEAGFSKYHHLLNRVEWSSLKAAVPGNPAGGAWGNQDSVRPPDEHAIWRSEVMLKGAGGGHRTRSAVSPTRVMEAPSYLLKYLQNVQ